MPGATSFFLAGAVQYSILYKTVVVLAGAVNNSRKVYCSRCDVMVVGVNG